MRGAAILLSALALACSDTKKSAPVPSRVVAVAAAPVESSEAELCDRVFEPASAPRLALPPLAEGKAPEAGAMWLNVWATWCPPCVEELPLLRKLEAQLRAGGKQVPLVLLSLDESAEAITQFRAKHPDLGTTLRIADPGAAEAWVTTVGLDRGATLPLHVFADREGRVRCARTGAVRESDLPRIEHLLAQP